MKGLKNMFYFLLFMLLAFAFGFFVGMFFKHSIDKEAIRTTVDENRKLHRENMNLKKHEVIEIVDHTAEPKSYFEPF